MKLLVKCPLCKREDVRVLFRPHWSKKYYEFICGYCKIEFSLQYDNTQNLDQQLKDGLDRYLIKYTGQTMEQRVKEIMETMTPEEMEERLKITYH